MKAVSLFSGVGAFEFALREVGVETVLSCEVDGHCCRVLKHHYPETEVRCCDVRELSGEHVRDRHGKVDILTAGFPCQSFSIAGKRQGFRDVVRGTLFFEVIRMADELGKPAYIFLENVKGLLSHEEGRTFGVILETLDELGYDAEWQCVNSRDFGVPQNRERVFVVGHLRGERTKQIFPIKGTGECPQDEEAQGKGFEISVIGNMQDNAARYTDECPTLTNAMGMGGGHVPMVSKIMLRDGRDNRSCLRAARTPEIGVAGRSIRRLTPVECQRLQGFPDDYYDGIDVSETQRYKQMGNTITIPVLRAIFRNLV